MADSLLVYPNYAVVYNTSIASIPNNCTDLSISIADPNVVQYVDSLFAFKSVSDTGSSYAVITYLSLTDTIYFINTNIDELSDCVIRTTSSGLYSDFTIWNKGIVPDICDSVIIMAGHNITLDTSSIIRSIYIEAGGILNMPDASSILQWVNLMMEIENCIVNGNLDISGGSLFVNGRLKLIVEVLSY